MDSKPQIVRIIYSNGWSIIYDHVHEKETAFDENNVEQPLPQWHLQGSDDEDLQEEEVTPWAPWAPSLSESEGEGEEKSDADDMDEDDGPPSWPADNMLHVSHDDRPARRKNLRWTARKSKD